MRWLAKLYPLLRDCLFGQLLPAFVLVPWAEAG
jgi:hypothetical protein